MSDIQSETTFLLQREMMMAQIFTSGNANLMSPYSDLMTR